MIRLPEILKTKITRENFILAGILVILLAIPLTVILLGIRQELRKRAAEEGSVLINAGAETTSSREVILALGAPDGAGTAPTQTFSGDAADGTILGYGSYKEARDTSYNSDDSNESLRIGQQDVGGTGRKKIDRGYILFDTSEIPDNATITDVRLCLRISAAGPLSNPFDVGIHKFDFSAPIGSSREGNYDGALAAPLDQNLVSLAIGGSVGPEVCNIVSLDPSWISKTGYTKYALLSSRDIAGQEPGRYEYENINFYSADSTSPPRLEVTYTSPSASLIPNISFVSRAQAADSGCTLSCHDAGLGIASCSVSSVAGAASCRIEHPTHTATVGGCGACAYWKYRYCAVDGSSPSGTATATVTAYDQSACVGQKLAFCSTSFEMNCDFGLPAPPVCEGLEGPDQAAPGSFNFFEISGDSGDFGLYGWKASCGSFPSGLISKTNSWTAPEELGTCTITASVGDGHGQKGECTKDVQVVETPPSGVEGMMISNYSDFSDSDIVWPYATTMPWTLTEGDGLKIVWAKFKVNGVWTTPVSDSITLDTGGPGPTPTPTLTPTPPPDGWLRLDLLKVWFQEQKDLLGRGHEGAVLLALKQGGGVVLEKAVQLDRNGEARNVELPGVSAGTYDAFIYQAGYLTKKLSNVSIGTSGNELDFTKNETEYFLVGDFNGDQEVNILDFSIFVESYGMSSTF